LRHVSLARIWLAGAVGGLASWIVSAPSELVKCRTQLHQATKSTSLATFKNVLRSHGLRGLYLAGAVTSVRDSVGYGFYFSAYELSRRLFSSQSREARTQAADFDVLVSGGIAGIMTWASIYPLDVIKTRIQAEGWKTEKGRHHQKPKVSALAMARKIFRSEGLKPFYRGLLVCSIRAFFVNAIQVVLGLPLSTSSCSLLVVVHLREDDGVFVNHLCHFSCPHLRKVHTNLRQLISFSRTCPVK
jgi:solute carrier family 25 (mitochondrial carnitine/acylcarnitine transporter), member 20/29